MWTSRFTRLQGIDSYPRTFWKKKIEFDNSLSKKKIIEKLKSGEGSNTGAEAREKD